MAAVRFSRDNASTVEIGTSFCALLNRRERSPEAGARSTPMRCHVNRILIYLREKDPKSESEKQREALHESLTYIEQVTGGIVRCVVPLDTLEPGYYLIFGDEDLGTEPIEDISLASHIVAKGLRGYAAKLLDAAEALETHG